MKPKEEETQMTKTILVVSLLFLLVSIHYFFSSIHNIDICQNDLRLQEIVHQKTGIFVELGEMDLNLDEQALTECYLKGLKWSIYSMYFIIASSIMVGYSISRIKE